MCTESLPIDGRNVILLSILVSAPRPNRSPYQSGERLTMSVSLRSLFWTFPAAFHTICPLFLHPLPLDSLTVTCSPVQFSSHFPHWDFTSAGISQEFYSLQNKNLVVLRIQV